MKENNYIYHEYEDKSMLTKEDYLKLVNNFKCSIKEAIPQINSYYDSPDFQLIEKNLTLRTRKKKGQPFELTLKEDLYGGRKEHTYKPLTDYERTKLKVQGVIPLKSNIKDALDRLKIECRIIYHGDLETWRIQIPYKGCIICLDHNKYLKAEDYEIEVERKEQTADEKMVMKDILEKLHLHYEKAKSKTWRFFERKKMLMPKYTTK